MHMSVLSVYIKDVPKEKLQPLVILEFYEQLTKHEIKSAQVFVEKDDFFMFLDPSGLLCSPSSYPETGIRCDVEVSGNGGNNLHIPLPNATQISIRESINTFLQTLGVERRHVRFEDLDRIKKEI